MAARLASTAPTIRLTSPERFSAWSPLSAASSSGTSAIRRYRSRYPASSATATELGIDWASAPGLERLDRPRDDRIGRGPDPGLERGRHLAGERGVHLVTQHAAGEAERLDPGLELARLHLARDREERLGEVDHHRADNPLGRELALVGVGPEREHTRALLHRLRSEEHT